jgi:hypothetical protein
LFLFFLCTVFFILVVSLWWFWALSCCKKSYLHDGSLLDLCWKHAGKI